MYEGADKRAVLQRVALTLQQTPQDQPDRRSIERIQLMDTVEQVATNLNLREQDVAPLIKEIVERSQLLIELDEHSSRYIFRHLTLQEFLVASELRNNPTLLMKDYRADHDGWREIVHLWCGVTSLDCTDVVREIFSGDANEKTLALQCVAEATSVDPIFAEEVVAYFIGLISSSAANRSIESALGAVASDDRPRGQSVLARLRELFLSDGPGHAGAAHALAGTRRTAAARILGERILADDAARSALRTMGEQAIPVLQATAASGDLRSVDDLGEIATASAASALITLIGDESDVAFRAAWWIAALVRRPEVEDGLQLGRQTVPAGVPLLDWVWRPFVDNDLTLTVPMGRVAWLLAHDVADHSPPTVPVIDHRLGITVVIFGAADELNPTSSPVQQVSHERTEKYNSNLQQAADQLEQKSGIRTAAYDLPDTLAYVAQRNPSEAASTIAGLIAATEIPKYRQRVFCCLPPGVQYQMIKDRIIVPPLPSRRVTVKQWTEATTPVKEPELLRTIVTITLITASLATIAAAGYRAFGPWFGATVGGPKWLDISAGFGIGILAIVGILLLASESGMDAPADIADAILDFLDDVTWVTVILLGASSLACIAIAVLIIYDHIGWKATAAAVGGASAVVLGLLLLIDRRERKIRNPFRKYMEVTPEELERNFAKSATPRRVSGTASSMM